jgi:hypothetical protein
MAPSGVLEGTFEVRNSFDAYVLGFYLEVAGSLRIVSEHLSTLALPELTAVGGDLIVEDNGALSAVELPNLVSIGGELRIVGNDQLQTVAAPALESIGSWYRVLLNETLPTLPNLDGLVSIGGVFAAGDNPSIQSLGTLASLTSTDGLSMERNESLTDISGLLSVNGVDGPFRFIENSTLPDCDVDEVFTTIGVGNITGTVSVWGNDDPCDPDPCGGLKCTIDCSEPSDFVCTCPGVVNPASSHCYFWATPAMTWYDAETACSDVGAHLATVADAAENTFINANFGGSKWIGLNDIALEGNWVWVTAEPVTYTHWATGEPDNNSGVQHCLVMASSGEWTDDECNAETGRMFEAVCERE